MTSLKSNKGGAPTKYIKSYAGQAKKLCLLGCNDKELSKFFCISVSTLNLWKHEHQEFSESLRGGKIIADAEVVTKLFKRATGFFYDEVTFEKISKNNSLEKENIKIDAYKKKVITKYVVPDVGAQTLWLKNRQKAKWRESERTKFENLTEDQLDEIINALKKK